MRGSGIAFGSRVACALSAITSHTKDQKSMVNILALELRSNIFGEALQHRLSGLSQGGWYF